MSDINPSSVLGVSVPDVPRASLILLSFNSVNRVVSAELEPVCDAQTATLESLRASLQEEGFGDFYAVDEVLRPVVLAANKAQTGRFIIAEQRDAKLELKVSPDKLTVRANVVKAYGGHALSREWLDAELRALGVPARCIISSALDDLVAKGEGQGCLLAQAVLAERGADAYLDILIDECKDLPLEEDAQGCVNFYQSHEFQVIDEGTPLARRIPPAAGKMGINVEGNVLVPEAGKDIPLGRDCDGTVVAPGDPNLLIAAVKGHPLVSPSGISVDPVLRLKSVNLATGNISFDGSVEIAGDVASGLSVQATGDIFIRGMVEKARITARRNVVIQGGVMGDDLGRNECDELILRTRLRAGGNISAKYMNFVEVIAGQNISVREYVMQSHLQAQGVIAIGQEGGKGCLIGGRARAGEQVAANILGSDAYIATEVRVGKDNLKRHWLERLKQAYKQAQHNGAQLRPLLEAPNASLTPDKKQLIQHALNEHTERQTRIRMIVERLLARLKGSFQHQITVKRRLHANVTLAIDGVTHISDVDGGPRCLVRMGADLVIKS